MARYIDADVLINEWNEKAAKMSRDRDGAIPVDFSLVISAVSKAPTLTLDDLRPKGRWVEGYPVTCSICGHSAETLYEDCNIYRAICTPYCSYCGADMRGGRVIERKIPHHAGAS